MKKQDFIYTSPQCEINEIEISSVIASSQTTNLNINNPFDSFPDEEEW